MVQIKALHISNFRGVSKVQIDLSNSPRSKVVTLIGLNESGKTTILEGLSHFPNTDRAAASMFPSRNVADLAGTFVPLHEAGVFSGDVQISGNFETTAEEREQIVSIVRANGHELDPSRPILNFEVSRTFEFKNGDYVPSKFTNIWSGIELYVRKSKGSKYKLSILPEDDEKARNDSLWMKVVEHLRTKLPNIVYFPNVVVDVPNRIYISKYKEETLANTYYRRAVEYILTDIGLSLEEHVVKRIDRYRGFKPEDRSWITKLLGSGDKDKIDAIFNRFASALTTEVMGSWSKVFNRAISATRVEVKWFVDTANNQPFIELKVSDGRSSYHLHQRSLGFRWFFSFLLFTRFGRDRKRTNIFLFDEPAANLHARAQAELLNSFNMLAEGGDFVIYSTHSHHMINPNWLPGAYIVQNAAIDYDSEDKGAISLIQNTDISVTPYRQFVGKHGNRISYYQPVIESLEYVEPQVVPHGHQVLVEGPSDFYALSYALRRSPFAGLFTVVPGSGGGSLGTLISIALARGHKFVVLLDDDDAGRKEAERYRRMFYLRDNVATLGDIREASKGQMLEGLLTEQALAKVAASYGNTKKKSIGLYLAEIAACDIDDGLGQETLTVLHELLAAIASRLDLEPHAAT